MLKTYSFGGFVFNFQTPKEYLTLKNESVFMSLF